MLQRTTIALNKDYLNFLKLVSLQKQQSLSQLVNEAVRFYLSKIDVKSGNKDFFENLAKLKTKLKLNKKELIFCVKKGRL